jgi:hypothetical protein
MTRWRGDDPVPRTDPVNEVVGFDRINLNHFAPTDFTEVNLGLDEREALAEAARCFQCGVCNQCELCMIFCGDMAIHPSADGALVRPDDYMEMRWQLQLAMHDAEREWEEIEAEWERSFGRRYGAIEAYRGEAVSLVKVKMFRPFPGARLREVLRGVDGVAVLDRNFSAGHGGIFAEEIRSALYDLPQEDRPVLFGYVLDLGGRDVTPAVLDEILEHTFDGAAPQRPDLWVGVKA